MEWEPYGNMMKTKSTSDNTITPQTGKIYYLSTTNLRVTSICDFSRYDDLVCGVLLCESNSTDEHDNSRLVQIAQGPVRGYMDPDDGIYSFYSIPYARVPTGNDRFKAPLSALIWSETFEGIDQEIVCPQSDLMNILAKSQLIKEDCLIANVYVPETNKTNLPVVIYVQVGAWVIGWGNMFTPKKLVKTKTIIAVTFNYRLGPQGFLCLGTKDVTGNAGMKDMVALVRWVKTNIANFGGNSHNIIISGFSSGASAVDLLILSKMTTGLFKKGVVESASGLSPFSVQFDPIENAKEYAKLLKYDKVDDLNALEGFYKSVPLEILNSAQVLYRKDSVTVMAPCVERDIGEERFLDDSPINILKIGNFDKLPMLYGFANMDGLFRFPVFDHWKDGMNTKFSDFLPADLHFENEKEKEEVAAQIKHLYFGDKLVDEHTILEYIDYFTEIMYAYPMLRSIKYQVKAGNNNIFLYQYSYIEENTPFIHTNKRGANHCAPTFAILDGYWNDSIIDEKDISEELRENKAYMKTFRLNFMTTGKPITDGTGTLDWPPVCANWSPHMSINRSLELKGFLLKESSLVLQDIYDKYYRYPIPPMMTAGKVEALRR